MATRNTVLSALLLGILGIGAWAFWAAERGPIAGSTPPSPPSPAAEKVPAPVVKPMMAAGDRPAPKAEQNPRDISLMTRLPDGTYVPNLNGVREPLTWNGPFSPIVRIHRTDLGEDWWVHENGMQSTTVMVEGTRNGVPFREAMIKCAFPIRPLPTVDAAGKNHKH